MERRRYLLSIIASAFKWLAYKFTYLYNSIIPTSVSGKQVLSKARLKTIEGNSVVENQLLDIPTTSKTTTINGITLTDNRDGTYTLNGTASALTEFNTILTNIEVINTHKYLLFGNYKFTSTFYMRITGLGNNNDIATILTCTSTINTATFKLVVESGTTLNNVKVAPKCVDLTQMFPFNTPTTLTDNRVQALINRGTIPYNVGEIKNSVVSEISSKDSNDTTIGTISLPAPLEIAGVGTAHNTFEVLKDSYRFTRNVFVVDLGTLTPWTYDSSHTRFYSNDIRSKYAVPNNNDVLANILCAKYELLTQNSLFNGTQDKTISCSNSGRISIRDTSLNGDTSLINGNIEIELATPQVINIPKKHLGCVDLSNATKTWSSGNNRWEITSLQSVIKKPSSNNEVCNIYNANLLTDSVNHAYTQQNVKSISVGTTGTVYVYGLNSSTQPSGTFFYETNDETSDFVNEATVESGGTLNSDSNVLPNVEMLLKCK